MKHASCIYRHSVYKAEFTLSPDAYGLLTSCIVVHLLVELLLCGIIFPGRSCAVIFSGIITLNLRLVIGSIIFRLSTAVSYGE